MYSVSKRIPILGVTFGGEITFVKYQSRDVTNESTRYKKYFYIKENIWKVSIAFYLRHQRTNKKTKAF